MLLALLIALVGSIIGGIALMSSGTLDGLYLINTQILNISFVKEFYAYSRTLALGIMVLVLSVKGINQWQLHRSGDPTADPKRLIVSAVIGVIVIFSSIEFVRLFLDLSNSILSDLLKKSMQFDSMASYATGDEAALVLDTMYKFVFSIAIFFVIYQVAYRTLEMIGLTILGPLFAVNIVSDNRDLFTGWMKHVAAVSLGHILQYVLLLFLFFATDELARNIRYGEDDLMRAVTDMMLRIAAIIYVVRAPKHLQKLLFSAGQSEGSGGGLSKIYYMRRMLSKR